jgi:hypothetical protein
MAELVLDQRCTINLSRRTPWAHPPVTDHNDVPHRLSQFCFILFAAALAGRAARGADVRLQLKGNTVYILPMAYGLDYYLASQFTSSRVLRVTVAPEKAEAVLTDIVDEAFRTWCKLHYGGLVPPSQPASYQRARPSPNPGTFFLVDPKTGTVLWSTYEPVERTYPNALDQVAVQVAKRLQKSLHPK